WLHGVAYNTARKARAAGARRRRREKQVATMPEPEAVRQDDGSALRSVIDEALSGLPEKYRLPIVLCDLEGKTCKEAALQLGWPQGTLAGRWARRRKMLATGLALGPAAVSSGSLAALLPLNVASARVPTPLLASTMKAASHLAAGQAATGVVSAR